MLSHCLQQNFTIMSPLVHVADEREAANIKRAGIKWESSDLNAVIDVLPCLVLAAPTTWIIFVTSA